MFLDLQRAAVSFYLNPKGKTHCVFLDHAQKVLGSMESIKAKKFSQRILQIEKEMNRLPMRKNKVRTLADEILTLGIILKA